MGIIWKVAKAELRNLFYSPIAWCLIVIFFVVSGIPFFDSIESISAYQQLMTEKSAGYTGASGSLSFLLFSGMLEKVVGVLYLFIPLLTMGAINREVNAGTMKLLYSSPLKSRAIVLGKFLGIAIFNLLLLVSIAIFLTTGIFTIKFPEISVFLSQLLGIYLLACTYSAIGIFVSSTTNYQIVAGIITFAVLMILQNISGLWQQYDFIRDLTYFLSIYARVDYILGGLITTRDLAYFILIIVLFISFTIIRIKSSQESKSWKVSFARYFSVFVVVLLLGYASSRPGYVGYLDVTRNKINTLQPQTQKMLAELGDEPLTVTLYTNLFGAGAQAGFPAKRNPYIRGFWDPYIRFHPNIKFKYVYYYDFLEGDSSFYKRFPGKSVEHIRDKLFEMYSLSPQLFKSPAEIRALVNLQPEGKRLVMELEYKGKKAFLRTFKDTKFWPDEMHVAGSIGKLTRDSTPKIAYTNANYERSIYKSGEREYSQLTTEKLSRAAMVNMGVDIEEIDLNSQDIPASLTALIVADPKSELSATAQKKIVGHINKGGNITFYGEPDKQHVLNPVLQHIGVSLDNGVIVNPKTGEMPQLLSTTITPTGTTIADEVTLLKYRLNPKPARLLKLIYDGSAAVSHVNDRGFKVDTLFNLKNAGNTWIENGHLVIDSAAPVFSPLEGDVKKESFATALMLTRSIHNKQQRIAVYGDADFTSRMRGSAPYFQNATHSWMVNNEYPVYLLAPEPTDVLLTINGNAGKAIGFTYLYIITGILIAMGSVILIRRKRK